MTTSDYINKLENLAKERLTFKNNVHNYKLAQKGLMENATIFVKPLIAEQVKTREAIQALQNDKQVDPKLQKEIEFQETFRIDFKNIDQNLPKTIRPVFSQDGFKIGNSYIEVDRERRLMRIHGKQNEYQITQELIDLIKGNPLENYSEPVLQDYKNLLQDVGATTKSYRFKKLNEMFNNGGGFSFLSDNVTELKDRLAKLTSAAKEGHSNVFNEGTAILKRLLEKKVITAQDFKMLTKIFS